VAERRALPPLLVALVVAPPVLHLAADGDAELEVARKVLVDRAVLALDHARPARAVRPERRPSVPDHPVVVVAVPVLHLPGVHNTGELEVAWCPVVGLHERRAAELDVRREAAAVAPRPGRAVHPPPVVQLAVLRPHDDLEVSRRAVVALDEARNAP